MRRKRVDFESLTQVEKSKLFSRYMFNLMQKYNFDRSVCVKRFVLWAKKNRYTHAINTPYNTFDRLCKKISVQPEFYETTHKLFRDLARVSSMVADEAIQTGDIQDYLALLPYQMKIINIQDKDGTVLQQFNQTNNTQVNMQERTDEVLQRLKSGFERFGPLVERLGVGTGNSREPALGVVHPALEAESSATRRPS